MSEIVIDILALVALALIGAGLWMAFGLPSALIFTGSILLALVLAVAISTKRSGGKE